MKRILTALFVCGVILHAGVAAADDLADIKARGVLRHLGVPYANFITGGGDGLCVDVMKLFAAHLGVKYEFVKTTWSDVIPDLIGHEVTVDGDTATLGKSKPIRGDVIDLGLTILPWRQKVLVYSTPTFPTQVWLITRVGNNISPIKATGDIDKDIAATKALVEKRGLLGKSGTCLEPTLYRLAEAGAKTSLFAGDMNELAPAVINGFSETAILDVPDVLVALEKWPGQVLVLGPISKRQEMGAGFRKESTGLLNEFNTFFSEIRKNGTYNNLVEKYYPAVFEYFPEFFGR